MTYSNQHRWILGAALGSAVAVFATISSTVAFVTKQPSTPIASAEIVQIDVIDMHEQPLPDFSAFRGTREKKEAFFDYIVPVIEERNAAVLADRRQLLAIEKTLQERRSLSQVQRERLQTLAFEYAVEPVDQAPIALIEQLLKRVDMVPVSLAVSQSATESAWGSSRFARQGNSLFGEWCFREGCGIVPGKRRPGDSHEVARFESPEESVDSYIRNLNTHPSYAEFRELRDRMRAQNQPLSGVALAAGLQDYSERGDHYVRELRHMIRRNQLHRFDSQRFDAQHTPDRSTLPATKKTS